MVYFQLCCLFVYTVQIFSKPIASALRTLSNVERKYDIGELEALACICGHEKHEVDT